MSNSNYMRQIINLVEYVHENEELNEILGFQTTKKVATNIAAKAGLSAAKRAVKKDEIISKLFSQMYVTWKKFISGNHNIQPYKNKKQDPKDPQTLNTFLHLVGFEDDDIDAILDSSSSNESSEISGQLINEFLSNPIKDVLQKAVKYAVDHNIKIGQGKATSSSLGDSQSKKLNDTRNSSEGSSNVGLESLDTNITSLIKKISPKAAESLELKLVDGFDVKASQIAAIINKAPNSAINQLALVGFAYLFQKTKGKSPAALSAPANKPAEKPKPKYTEL